MYSVRFMAQKKGVKTSRKGHVWVAHPAPADSSWDADSDQRADPMSEQRLSFRHDLVGHVFGYAEIGDCDDEDALRRLTGRKSSGLLGVGLRPGDWRPWELDLGYLASQFQGNGGETRRDRLESCLAQILREKKQGVTMKRLLKKLFVALEKDLYLPRVRRPRCLSFPLDVYYYLSRVGTRRCPGAIPEPREGRHGVQ